MEEKKDQDKPSSSSSSPSPSPLPSHDAVCKYLFSDYRGTTMYQLYSKFYSTMVRQCPQSGMEEIQRAVKDGNKKEAFDILNRLFDAHTASGDLHRINAEIYAHYLAEADNPSDREENLKKGIDSAIASCRLSCSDIENHFVLISLVSQHARGEQGRQQVIRLCHEALAIDKYNDKDDPASPTSARSKITNFLQSERQQRIESFWKPMLNKHYTLVSIADLHTFVKNESDIEIILEAWHFGLSHRSWKFWMCYCCEDKFESSGLLFKHFADTHLTPQAKSIICAGTLLHGNPSSSCGRVPIQEWISVHAASSQLIVATSCLLNQDTETSQTDFPSRDLSIKADSYRGKLIDWVYFRDSARSQGAGIPLFLEKMSRMKQAKSAGVITGISDLKITDDAQGTDAIEKALERLSADIDSELQKKGEWILRTEEGIEDLTITENPFGEFDYRDILLPVVKSYIWACVEEQADKEAPVQFDP